MKPIEPIQPAGMVARRIVLGAGQPRYNPLPALVEPDGTVHSRWELTLEERRAITDGACVTLAMLTFNEPLQPVHLQVEGVGEPVEIPPTERCRVCGCTDARACPGGCSWAAPNLCTSCVKGKR